MGRTQNGRPKAGPRAGRKIGVSGKMDAGVDGLIQTAYFISPIVDMEKLISDMMKWAKVTETEMEAYGVIYTEFGENLS